MLKQGLARRKGEQNHPRESLLELLDRACLEGWDTHC